MMKTALKVIVMALVIVGLLTGLTSAKSKRSEGTAWLGVYTQTVDKDLAKGFDLSVDRGAIINEVVNDSPAEEAGLLEDDIVVRFDNQRVRDAEDLTELVQEAEPGSSADIVVIRDGKEVTLTAELGSRKSHDTYSWKKEDQYRPCPG
jgi:S1-C subfamily serine protease